MGFLDEIRKKNRLAKSLVSNGLAPSFDVAVKMAEARMRVESGAQEPIDSKSSQIQTTTLSGLKTAVSSSFSKEQEKALSLEEQRKASIMMYQPQEEQKNKVDTFAPIQAQQNENKKEGMNMGTIDIERILAENTKFITEQLIDFKSQLATMAASIELVKQEVASVKHELGQVKSMSRTSNISSQSSEGVSKHHNDSSGGQHFAIQPPAGQQEKKGNPRSDPDKINPEDVSIEKMFNFSHKRFK
jgi:hypothetical protein